MGKSPSDSNKLFTLPPATGLKTRDQPDTPPQIPPRMKKKGPALPEKPAHMRAKSQASSSQPSTREPLRPRLLNPERPSHREGSVEKAAQREVLVAASKSGRDRPVERRQREPAKLLMPTKKELAMPSIHLEERIPSMPSSKLTAVQSSKVLQDLLPAKSLQSNPLWSSAEEPSLLKRPDRKQSVLRKSLPLQPVLLIPRKLVTWGSTSGASYALWTTQRDVGRGLAVQRPVRVQGKEISGTVRLRSNSVTRSGSLTSQGSSGSDSGGETFPKSVLKKQRRGAAAAQGTGSHSNRKVDQKKIVTFNAFATVQLMDE